MLQDLKLCFCTSYLVVFSEWLVIMSLGKMGFRERERERVH